MKIAFRRVLPVSHELPVCEHRTPENRDRSDLDRDAKVAFCFHTNLKSNLVRIKHESHNSDTTLTMKVRYLTTLATVSVLSLGFAFGCSNPCAAKEKPASNGAETSVESEKENPCASDNPCAAKDENPCAGDNPCAAKDENPCAGDNPCAAKDENPCAAN